MSEPSWPGCIVDGDVCPSEFGESHHRGCVEAQDDRDPIHLWVEAVQVNGDAVLVGCSGNSFAAMLCGSVARFGLVVEHEIGVTAHLPIGGERKRRQVGIDRRALLPRAAHRDI